LSQGKKFLNFGNVDSLERPYYLVNSAIDGSIIFIYSRDYILYKYQDGYPIKMIPHNFYDDFDYVYFDFMYIKPYIIALSNSNLNVIDEETGIRFKTDIGGFGFKYDESINTLFFFERNFRIQ
jgi:hypothetical protein